ncbi:hypothetical protein G7054_g5332 [Neopestalotiopsis clavispora]|nr:hypothetical protein G7054_g5332 [Neopestalotiopsis clavispora]
MLWRNRHTVLFGVASAAASAHLAPRPAANANANAVRDVAPRQTDSTLSQLLDFANDLGLTACIPQALPLAAELPAIPPGLLNNDLFAQALSQTTLALSDVCRFSVTGSDGPKFTSFLPAVYSWYDEHSSQVASVVAGCPSASPLVQTVEAYGACSQVVTATTGAAASILPASITADSTVMTGSDALSIQTDTETFSIETDTVISDSTLSITEPTATATESSSSSSTGETDTATTDSASSSATETTASESSSSSSVSQAQAPRETGFVIAAAAVAGFIGAVAAL